MDRGSSEDEGAAESRETAAGAEAAPPEASEGAGGAVAPQLVQNRAVISSAEAIFAAALYMYVFGGVFFMAASPLRNSGDTVQVYDGGGEIIQERIYARFFIYSSAVRRIDLLFGAARLV